MPLTLRPPTSAVTYDARPVLKLILAYVIAFYLQTAPLVLNGGLAYAKWVPIEKNNQMTGSMTIYVDPESVHRQGDSVLIWQLIDYRTMQGGKNPGSRFSSMKMHKQFDCIEGRVRLLKATVFWGNMATGDPTEAYVEDSNWVLVEPDSVDQALWEVACKQ
jgi:hypothetical protein